MPTYFDYRGHPVVTGRWRCFGRRSREEPWVELRFRDVKGLEPMPEDEWRARFEPDYGPLDHPDPDDPEGVEGKALRALVMGRVFQRAGREWGEPERLVEGIRMEEGAKAKLVRLRKEGEAGGGDG